MIKFLTADFNYLRFTLILLICSYISSLPEMFSSFRKNKIKMGKFYKPNSRVSIDGFQFTKAHQNRKLGRMIGLCRIVDCQGSFVPHKTFQTRERLRK